MDTGAGKHHSGIIPLAYQPQDAVLPWPNSLQAPVLDASGQAINWAGTQPNPQQTGYFKTSCAHSCPWTGPCSPEGPGPRPTLQCIGTRTGTPRALQPETLGPSSTHQWVDTSHKTTAALQPVDLDHHQQARPCPGTWPHTPGSSLGTNLTHQQAESSHKTTIALQPTNPAPPPAGQILPCDQLGPGPTYYQANTSLKTPWTLQPTVSGSGPTHQQFGTSSGTPGPCNQTPGSSSAPLQACTSPKTWFHPPLGRQQHQGLLDPDCAHQ